MHTPLEICEEVLSSKYYAQTELHTWTNQTESLWQAVSKCSKTSTSSFAINWEKRQQRSIQCCIEPVSGIWSITLCPVCATSLLSIKWLLDPLPCSPGLMPPYFFASLPSMSHERLTICRCTGNSTTCNDVLSNYEQSLPWQFSATL